MSSEKVYNGTPTQKQGTRTGDAIVHKAESTTIRSLSVKLAGSNMPCEDRYSVRTRPGVQAFAVLDGHGGYLAADIACTNLLDIILNEIDKVGMSDIATEKVCEILDKSFVECDDMILKEAIRIKKYRESPDYVRSFEDNSKQSAAYSRRGHAVHLKPTGRAGCCALVMVVLNGIMYFGHSGDCRAVLCQSFEKIYDGAGPYSSNATNASNDDAVLPFLPLTENENQETSTEAKASLYENTDSNVPDDSDSERQKKSPKLKITDSAGAKAKSDEHENKCSPGSTSTAGVGEQNDKMGKFAVKDYFLESHSKINADSEENVFKNIKKRERFREEGGEHFTFSDDHCLVGGITLDHNCNVEDEIRAVQIVTNDTNPIRCSINERKGVPLNAPLRVAGSLVVTRALGDGYLKQKELSVEPYVSFCPYITCRPSISWKAIDQMKDKAIILASDGLWNYVNAKDCSVVIEDIEADFTPYKQTNKRNIPTAFRYDSHHASATSKTGDSGYDMVVGADNGDIFNQGESATTTTTTTDKGKGGHGSGSEGEDGDEDSAETLMNICLDSAAFFSKTPRNTLRNMPAGQSRREIVDDITVMVLYF